MQGLRKTVYPVRGLRRKISHVPLENRRLLPGMRERIFFQAGEERRNGGNGMNVYLDHAATAPLAAPVKDYAASLLGLLGNPSSEHSAGEYSRAVLKDARRAVAKLIGADPSDLSFTPSGSASNTLAVRGYCEKHSCKILYSPIAHKSILSCLEHNPHAFPLQVDHNGFIDMNDLKARAGAGGQKPFAVIDYANSEIGTVQDVERIIGLIHALGGTVYLDCTGSLPAIPIDVKTLDADMLGFSGHKLGALSGCGALWKKPGIELNPLICGSQERGLSGGTENMIGIASFGKAAECYDYSSKTSDARDYIYGYIKRRIKDCYLVGPSKNRLPHNLYMCFRGVEGESLMFLLDSRGIQVSTGSACNSESPSASKALSAIGMDKNDMRSCIRLSFGGTETKEELDYACRQLSRCVQTLRGLNAAHAAGKGGKNALYAL